MEKVAKNDLGEVVKRVLAHLPKKEERPGRAALLTLEGELGAGKTTFVQTLAKELGVAETVQSPTYVLMKSYELSGGVYKKLVHIDAYRLAGAHEFEGLNPSAFLLDEDALVCIEWPSRIEGALPKPNLTLEFSSEGAGESERYIKIA